MSDHHEYLRRCLQLARLGAGRVAPNPMVGAVLVHQERIIGEGYHQIYGGPHAEVNCLGCVSQHDLELVPSSTLYVSLEPCAHHGKTPPCADLVIEKKISKVVIGSRDPFFAVNGKGIEKLQKAGIEVIQGVLESECMQLNQRFFTFHERKRPMVILKWAQTADGFMGNEDHSRLMISGPQANRLVHKWRSEESAILVGTHTALYDDPSLTTRLWPGDNPVRLVIDKDLRLPAGLKLFDKKNTTIVFNQHRHDLPGDTARGYKNHRGVYYYQLGRNASLVQEVLDGCYQLGLQSVLVEGGAQTLRGFIDEGAWDEIRLIINNRMITQQGVAAPGLPPRAWLKHQMMTGDDQLSIYENREKF